MVLMVMMMMILFSSRSVSGLVMIPATPMSSSSSSGKSNAEDDRNSVNQIIKQTPILTESNFSEWKRSIQIVKFVRGWSDEVFAPSQDQSKEDPSDPVFHHRLILWQVLNLTTRGNFNYLTEQLPLGDAVKAWHQVSNHFERRNAQFARDLTAKFFNLLMTSTGLALKQFANRVQRLQSTD